MFIEPSLICEVKPILNKMEVLDYTPTKLTLKMADTIRAKQEVEYIVELQ